MRLWLKSDRLHNGQIDCRVARPISGRKSVIAMQVEAISSCEVEACTCGGVPRVEPYPTALQQ